MKSKYLVSACAGALLLTALATPASANHSWGGYHWASEFMPTKDQPIRLLVVDSVTSDWDGNLVGALTEWSISDVFDLSATSHDDSKRTRKRCQSVDGQMRVCNAKYGFNGWLGLASINIDSSNHIVRGVAKMNDSYSSYWTSEEEKNHVMCQEIGHVLGLAHTSEDGSSQNTCMDYSNSSMSQWPNQHDYNELLTIYDHADGYNSWDTGSSSGGNSGCNAPPGKGCNKNQSGEIPPMGTRVFRGQGFEIWIAPGANNTLWVHHVTLVPYLSNGR